MKPLQVPRTATSAELWNVYVKLCFLGAPDYSPTQRIAHLAFLYDAEVQNGGHHQYFENQGLAKARETVLALDLLGAQRQRHALEAAVKIYERINPEERKAESREEFAEAALEGHYRHFDDAFSGAKPDLTEYLKAWLHSNLDDFVERIP